MPSEILHASTVALNGRAVMILGASGRGKSALALQLMAYGAQLVADDRTILSDDPEGGLWVRCPDTITNRIEARGVGLLAAQAVPAARLCLVVDLDQTETHRLPPERKVTLMGQEVDLLLGVEHAHFAPAILQYLKSGRVA